MKSTRAIASEWDSMQLSFQSFVRSLFRVSAYASSLSISAAEFLSGLTDSMKNASSFLVLLTSFSISSHRFLSSKCYFHLESYFRLRGSWKLLTSFIPDSAFFYFSCSSLSMGLIISSSFHISYASLLDRRVSSHCELSSGKQLSKMRQIRGLNPFTSSVIPLNESLSRTCRLTT